MYVTSFSSIFFLFLMLVTPKEDIFFWPPSRVYILKQKRYLNSVSIYPKWDSNLGLSKTFHDLTIGYVSLRPLSHHGWINQVFFIFSITWTFSEHKILASLNKTLMGPARENLVLKPWCDLCKYAHNLLRKWRVRKNRNFLYFYANAPFTQTFMQPIYVSRTQPLTH